MKTTKNTTIFCAAFMALITIEATAQTPTWSWATDSDGDESEFSGAIAAGTDETLYAHVLFDGSFSIGDVVVDSPPPFFNGSVYSGLAKFTGNGEPEWIIPFPDPDLGYNIFCDGVATDSENNVYVAGTLSRQNAAGDFQVNFAGLEFEVPASASSDGFVAKIDPDGNGVWVKHLSTPANPATGLQAFDVAVDENDIVYFSGTFSSTIEINETLHSSFGLMDLFLAGLTADGEFLWATPIGGIEDDYFARISPAAGGGLLICSMWTNETVYVGGLEVSNPNPMIGANFDRWIAKINSEGLAEWLVREGGPGNQLAGRIVSTPTGGAVVVSLIGTSSITLNGQVYNEPGFLLTRYDASGDLEQVAHYPANTSNYVIGTDGNDTYYFGIEYTSSTFSFGDFQLTNSGWLTGTQDFMVAAVDGTGTPLWALKVGSVETESIRGMAFSENHGLVIGGSFGGSTSLSFGDHTIENEGSLNADFFIAALDFTSSAVTAAGVKPLYIYPNPAQAQVAVDLSSLSTQQHTLRIFDSRGALIASQNVSGRSIENIDVNHLPAGNYVMLIQEGEALYASKFIKL